MRGAFMTPVKTFRGYSYPLGATWTGDGVNFAIFSQHATGVELCLFDSVNNTEDNVRIPLKERTGHVWHVFLPDARPGQLYGFRVSGPYDPERGLRFNNSKLLLDPYAKAIAGAVSWADEMFGYVIGDEKQDLTQDFRDNAWGVPKSIVIDTGFDWQGDKRPAIPLHESVIYEVHVKGFSKLWREMPEQLRGTYAGLGSQLAIDYFKKLGVTALELLPVHAHSDDKFLADHGLTNYWGYNTIGFFAPHEEYSGSGQLGQQVAEFKAMVRSLHAAGIEVILDVVYNHTGEGNHLGPTLCFRGIDNLAYYWLHPENPRFYLDFTGTGNTFNLLHPRTLQLVTDSLRYWVLEMHVDGFRFDLASALARDHSGFNTLHPFFQVIQQDPVLSQVKLIAEPWDIGEGGYQVGNFPVSWSEWNGKYRDSVRSFWKGDEGRIGEMAYRLTGSPDLYEHDDRRPYASINFVIAHDGFTLSDLVSYNEKHNELNGDDNRDGDNNNLSWNCGVDGPTEDPQINALRDRQRRNFLTTLFLSQGVPMLCGGDELGRTQSGNNNGYCQDNEISWFNWHRDDKQNLEFTRKLIQLRQEHPVFRRASFLTGREVLGSGLPDVWWFRPDGRRMTQKDWQRQDAHSLGVFLNGQEIPNRTPDGKDIVDDSFLVLFNAYADPITFTLPTRRLGSRWRVEIATGPPGAPEDTIAARAAVRVEGRSLILLRRD